MRAGEFGTVIFTSAKCMYRRSPHSCHTHRRCERHPRKGVIDTAEAQPNTKQTYGSVANSRDPLGSDFFGSILFGSVLFQVMYSFGNIRFSEYTVPL